VTAVAPNASLTRLALQIALVPANLASVAYRSAMQTTKMQVQQQLSSSRAAGCVQRPLLTTRPALRSSRPTLKGKCFNCLNALICALPGSVICPSSAPAHHQLLCQQHPLVHTTARPGAHCNTSPSSALHQQLSPGVSSLGCGPCVNVSIICCLSLVLQSMLLPHPLSTQKT
jgi:hypothetical protein